MKANVQYNGYHLCSYYFTECAYADLARTRQLLTAVPAFAVEEVSLIDEATEATLDRLLGTCPGLHKAPTSHLRGLDYLSVVKAAVDHLT
ncbi:hypothetical protein HPB52_009235 [Rhipicephalus sanguineus]|uniref:Uncharacterized protein n=1 Tax=Rhipicephalus sanguineus TaxID=34632 RepID=A0A9D4PYZ8_RHISA|nr:hypothetical protein HPB52_009235 [Rhipicephalus sanguineus]